MSKPLELIHYGNTSFDPNQFHPIKNRVGTQSYGGFWASPLHTSYGWKDFCEDFEIDEFVDRLDKSFVFTLRPDTRIYTIDCYEDLDKLPLQTHEQKLTTPIDFEKLSQAYDAVYLSQAGYKNTRLSRPKSTYGWDCESILIMNPDSIQTL